MQFYCLKIRIPSLNLKQKLDQHIVQFSTLAKIDILHITRLVLQKGVWIQWNCSDRRRHVVEYFTACFAFATTIE